MILLERQIQKLYNCTSKFRSKYFRCGHLPRDDYVCYKKEPRINWFSGDVEKLPFSSGQFKGATCILAIHHFKDLHKSFKEVYRVLDAGSRFVIFTSSPEQMER